MGRYVYASDGLRCCRRGGGDHPSGPRPALRDGTLQARHAFGRAPVLDDIAVLAWKRSRSRGRRWGQRATHAALDLLSTGTTTEFTGSELSRLRRVVRTAPPNHLAYLAGGLGGTWDRYRALETVKGLILIGPSAASDILRFKHGRPSEDVLRRSTTLTSSRPAPSTPSTETETSASSNGAPISEPPASCSTRTCSATAANPPQQHRHSSSAHVTSDPFELLEEITGVLPPAHRMLACGREVSDAPDLHASHREAVFARSAPYDGRSQGWIPAPRLLVSARVGDIDSGDGPVSGPLHRCLGNPPGGILLKRKDDRRQR